jgi:hypothetical protein
MSSKIHNRLKPVSRVALQKLLAGLEASNALRESTKGGTPADHSVLNGR